MKMSTANLLRLSKGVNSNSHLEQYHTQSAGLVFCMNDNSSKVFGEKVLISRDSLRVIQGLFLLAVIYPLVSLPPPPPYPTLKP